MSPSVNFRTGSNLINSTIILSCGLYLNIFNVKYLIQVSTKTITCILYDPSYFGKIINILHILKGGCKLLTSTIYNQTSIYSYLVCDGKVLLKF